MPFRSYGGASVPATPTPVQPSDLHVLATLLACMEPNPRLGTFGIAGIPVREVMGRLGWPR